MHTNEEDFSRVYCELNKHFEGVICAWHTEIQENGIISVNCILAFVQMNLQVFRIEVFQRMLHHRDVILSYKSFVLRAYLGNKAVNCFWFNIPHTVHAAVILTSHLSVFSGNCRLHLSLTTFSSVSELYLKKTSVFCWFQLLSFHCSSSPASWFGIRMIP